MTREAGEDREPTRADACWIAEGHLVVMFDGAASPRHRVFEVSVDGATVYRLEGDSRFAGTRSLRNGDFDEGVDGWDLIDSPTADLGVDLAPEWALSDGHTAFVRDMDQASRGATLRYVADAGDGLVRVHPGQGYDLSLLVGTHRCTADVVLEFLDEGSKVLGESRRRLESGHVGGRAAHDYAHVSLSGVVPVGSAWTRLSLRKSQTIPGAQDSYLFVSRVGFALRDSDDGGSTALHAPHAAPTTWATPQVVALPLPADVTDGLAHGLKVRDAETGTVVSGSPLSLEPMAPCDGGVEEVSGSTLLGWARARQDPQLQVDVSVSIDGQEVARVTADAEHATGNHGFSVAIPQSLLDGVGHYVAVRTLPDGYLLDESVRLFSRILTPWEALQAHASDPLPGTLAPQAAHRYRSLGLDIAAAAQGGGYSATRLPQLGRAHDVLLRGPANNRRFEPLEFPEPSDPVVSVVVPVFGKFEMTYNCLAGLLFAHNAVPFEIIVIDDASDDRTRDLPGIVKGISYLRNEQNQGFLRSCNTAAERARGEFLTFLNNDTEPTAGWLDEMVAVFRNYPDVGLVGSKLLYPDGRLQEAGGIVWETGDPWNFGRDHNAHLPPFNYTREADYVSGAAMTVERAIWEQVGGFSEEFAPAYFEDTDLAFKIREAGKRVIYAPLSVVFHHEGVSGGTDTDSGAKAFQEFNRPKFKAKWAEALHRHPGTDIDPRLAADIPGRRRRVLFVDYAVPQPDRSAGAYAAVQEMRLFQALGYKVTFFPENLAWLGADTEYLQRMGIEVVSAPHSFSLSSLLEERGAELDVVYLTRFDTALRGIEPIRRLAPRAKVLLQLADLHFLRQIREAESGNGSMDTALATRAQEMQAIGSVDVTLSYSDAELELLRDGGLPAERLALAPWVIDPEPSIPPLAGRDGVAFLSSKSHPPNRQALAYFCDEVMPLVRERRPGTSLHVYGYGWDEEDAARHDADDIVFHGFVEHVGDAYGSHRVAVAPLISGAGLKGKVIEALVHGLPQVLSPVAAEGTGLTSSAEAYVVDTADEWAARTVELCDDDARWSAMSEAAQDYARTHFSFEEGLDLMRRALEVAGEHPDPDANGLATRAARPTWPAARV